MANGVLKLDYFLVFLDSDKQKSLGRFCGSNSSDLRFEGPVYSMRGLGIRLDFKTDNSRRYLGFSLSAKLVPYSKYSAQPIFD